MRAFVRCEAVLCDLLILVCISKNDTLVVVHVANNGHDVDTKYVVSARDSLQKLLTPNGVSRAFKNS